MIAKCEDIVPGQRIYWIDYKHRMVSDIVEHLGPGSDPDNPWEIHTKSGFYVSSFEAFRSVEAVRYQATFRLHKKVERMRSKLIRKEQYLRNLQSNKRVGVIEYNADIDGGVVYDD